VSAQPNPGTQARIGLQRRRKAKGIQKTQKNPSWFFLRLLSFFRVFCVEDRCAPRRRGSAARSPPAYVGPRMSGLNMRPFANHARRATAGIRRPAVSAQPNPGISGSPRIRRRRKTKGNAKDAEESFLVSSASFVFLPRLMR
jgi:hypothetical protein